MSDDSARRSDAEVERRSGPGGAGSGLAGFGSQPHRPAKGRVGEDAAVEWLLARGYAVVERNARTPVGEFDLIALDGETLCFVEIKARATAEYGTSLEAVHPRKQRRLVRCASAWLAGAGRLERPCRFDVVGLDRDEAGEWTLRLVKDAFSAF